MTATDFSAQDVAVLVADSHERMAGLEQELNAADAILGDGDTGSMLARVIGKMAEVPIDPYADLGVTFGSLAKATLAATGSSLGTLIATALMIFAKSTKGQQVVAVRDLSGLLGQARDAMLARGGASLGDKTVLDGLDLVAGALSGVADRENAALIARKSAADALDRFRNLPCKVGRARMFPEKSTGADDPGMLALARLIGRPAD